MEMRLLHAPVRADLVAAAYARAEADGVTLADVVAAALEAHLRVPADPAPTRSRRSRTKAR